MSCEYCGRNTVHVCPPMSWVSPRGDVARVRQSPDPVTAPSHYRVGPYECREVAAALGLNFNRGSALKYLWRAGRKYGTDELTDLRKAVECLTFEIKRLEAKP